MKAWKTRVFKFEEYLSDLTSFLFVSRMHGFHVASGQLEVIQVTTPISSLYLKPQSLEFDSFVERSSVQQAENADAVRLLYERIDSNTTSVNNRPPD